MTRRLTWTWALFAAFFITIHATSFADDELATTPVSRPDDWWQQRHQKINDRARQGDVDLLFVGDSITQGWEGDTGREIWEKFYGARKAMNAGIGGDRTQHVLWRLDNGNVDGVKPKLAVLMIGTNNSGTDEPDDVAAGITAIVEKLRSKLPDTKILLLGIFPRGENNEDSKRKSNVAANKIIESLDDGKSVFYLDISEKFLGEDGTLEREIMPDLLHLSKQGYEIWAESIEPKVAELLGKQ
ncbi:MAG TPA: platelet-activating factor acetylhydrolase IB subunit [Pirellulales bacterium]|jgi:beta-glucosidase|nr:platelet-activating factor acetylhydrolase IB subunit [Pirellulales bacterium]